MFTFKKFLLNDNLSGIAFMVVAIFSLTTMDAIAKFLVQDKYDPIQILAMRSVFILIVMLVYYGYSKKLGYLKTGKPIAQATRGIIGFMAPYFFFKSLQVLPLADATVIFFSSTLMITALSGPLLKEKVGIYRWSAVIIGFGGVLIAIEPEGTGSILSYIYCLLGSLAYSLLFLSGRWLSKTETVDSLVFYFNLSLLIFSACLSPLVWQTVPSDDYGFIFIFSLLALIGHFLITTAFSKADAGLLAPLEYTALIWAALWGYLIWSDIPSTQVILGGFIIIFCSLFVTLREHIVAKKTASNSST